MRGGGQHNFPETGVEWACAEQVFDGLRDAIERRRVVREIQAVNAMSGCPGAACLALLQHPNPDNPEDLNLLRGKFGSIDQKFGISLC